MRVIKSNLTFGSAMNALRKGHKVTRAIWGGYWFLPRTAPKFIGTDGQEHRMKSLILSNLKNHLGIVPAQPYNVDMMATDWEIVK